MFEPKWIKDIKNPRALLLVAHPDDETIFAGGLILSTRNVEWTIVCCFIQRPIRAREFNNACTFLSRESHNRIIPIESSHTPKTDETLRKELAHYTEGYDIVITHNYGGEYEGISWAPDHHHVRVNRCVINTINHPNTWLFISPGSWNVNQDEFKSRHPRGNVRLEYPPHILNLKKRALAYHESQLEFNLRFDPETGVFLQGDLQPTLQYNFEDPGQEEFTFFDKEIFENILRRV